MRTTRLLLLTGLAATAACAGGSLAQLAPARPAVRLHHLSIKSIGLAGGALDVVLAFHNPNRIVLKGTRLNAGLDIETTHFGDIALNEPFQLTASDTSLITVPLTFQWAGVGAAARSLLNYGSVNYQINGTASVDTPIGTSLDVPFAGQGNVPLLKAVR
jgi:hypothetical protein